MLNFLKRILRRTLEILEGDGKSRDWIEDVAHFFTTYIFPILAFLLIFLLHMYFSKHVKLCQVPFLESFGIMQGDYMTAMWFFYGQTKLTRMTCMIIFTVVYTFMYTSYSDGMHSESMQEALHMIRLEKEEFRRQLKEYIKKVQESFKSNK